MTIDIPHLLHDFIPKRLKYYDKYHDDDDECHDEYNYYNKNNDDGKSDEIECYIDQNNNL